MPTETIHILIVSNYDSYHESYKVSAVYAGTTQQEMFRRFLDVRGGPLTPFLDLSRMSEPGVFESFCGIANRLIGPNTTVEYFQSKGE